MDDLAGEVDRVAGETNFSGAVRVDVGGEVAVASAYGLADRAHRVPNTVETQFATASATKGLTALTVVSLIESGVLGLDTTARSLLGDDLPLIADDVTVEHLLSHRSGIGDYLDESSGYGPTDYVMPVSVHELATTESFLRVLDGYPTAFPAGERFAYCNSGYVVLAILAERASGTTFTDLVAARVIGRAGMTDTAFLRSDELPGSVAIGYLGNDSPRTNVFHLPVVGTGDGGIYTTVADVDALWNAVFGSSEARGWTR
jgi:CubicO group peptidase (beta-lactamase class C family)